MHNLSWMVEGGGGVLLIRKMYNQTFSIQSNVKNCLFFLINILLDTFNFLELILENLKHN